jgi:hypothetical protein
MPHTCSTGKKKMCHVLHWLQKLLPRINSSYLHSHSFDKNRSLGCTLGSKAEERITIPWCWKWKPVNYNAIHSSAQGQKKKALLIWNEGMFLDLVKKH